MTTSQDIEMVLGARVYLYRVFNAIFGNEPSNQLGDQLDHNLIEQSFSVVGCEGNTFQGCNTFVAELQESTDFDSLKNLYNALFVGPATPAALPWEAMYTTKNRRLFGPVALEVRKCYRAQGFIPHSYPHVSDDALALEIDFLAGLAQRSLERFEENGDWKEPLVASNQFIGEHLGLWVDRLANAVVQYREGTFYAKAAVALAEYVKADHLWLRNMS